MNIASINPPTLASGGYRYPLNKTTQPQHRSLAGFTLVELMMSLAIFMLIASIGLPSLNKLINNQQARATMQQLVKLVSRARSEAVYRGEIVTLCPTADEITCSKDWNLPLIMFTDPNHNEAMDADETLICFGQAVQHGDLSFSNHGRPYIQYKPTGHSNGVAGTFSFTPNRGTARTRKLTIIPSGRLSLKAAEDSSG